MALASVITASNAILLIEQMNAREFLIAVVTSLGLAMAAGSAAYALFRKRFLRQKKPSIAEPLKAALPSGWPAARASSGS
jgi:peptidoglycan/LPS O-acetylase OafA/YrhL